METQPVVCRDLVELVTEYLDDALPPGLRAAVVRHLDGCDGCVEYVRLMVRTADELVRSSPAQPPLAARIRHALLHAFHARA